MLDTDLFGQEIACGTLKERFGIIPFSVLDTKTSEWRQRKQKWINLGIQSELGRAEDLMGFKRIYSKGKPRLFDRSASVFDPVLCEVIYDWFCIKDGSVLDSFAGGSVRGIVASSKGLEYTGIEIREEQVLSNLEQASRICGNKTPDWIIGDSYSELPKISKNFDLAFTCPPYFDLEKYSDQDGDLSNMEWDKFVDRFQKILSSTCSLIKENRFFCIVIGDVRDRERPINWYRNLTGITKSTIIDCGLHFYNEMILLDGIGSSAMRISQAFSKRKVVKTHQNIYVFYKGKDVNDIRDEFGKNGLC